MWEKRICIVSLHHFKEMCVYLIHESSEGDSWLKSGIILRGKITLEQLPKIIRSPKTHYSSHLPHTRTHAVLCTFLLAQTEL